MGKDLEIDPSQEILESKFLISIACEPEDGPAQARRTPAKQPCSLSVSLRTIPHKPEEPQPWQIAAFDP
jgi:hypothetical protein